MTMNELRLLESWFDFEVLFLLFVDEIANLFPNLYGQTSAVMEQSESGGLEAEQKLKIGVVLSGGQAPGGHNVISGIFGEGLVFINLDPVMFVTMLICLVEFVLKLLFCLVDYLQQRTNGSTMYGFKGGPAGIMKCKYVELNPDFIYPYRNQVWYMYDVSSFFGMVRFVCVLVRSSETHIGLLKMIRVALT